MGCATGGNWRSPGWRAGRGGQMEGREGGEGGQRAIKGSRFVLEFDQMDKECDK